MVTLSGSISRSVSKSAFKSALKLVLRSAIVGLFVLIAGTGRAQDERQDPTKPQSGSAGAVFSETPLCDYTGPGRSLNQDTVRIADTMSRVAAVVKRRGKEHVGINGRDGKAILGKAYQAIVLPRELQAREAIRFNEEWTRFGYAATNEKGQYVLVIHDGTEEKESEPYEFMLDGMPVWSSDGRSYAYGVVKKGKYHVVTHAEVLPAVDDLQVGTITWSPNGLTLAYSARAGRAWVVRCGAQRYPAEQGVSESGLRFNGNSTRIAYAAQRRGGWVLMSAMVGLAAAAPVNGFVYEAVARTSPVWSEDAMHLAWAARRAGKWWIVVDGVETGPYDAIAEGGPVWSKAMNHIAYGALDKGAWRVFTQTLAGVRTEVAAGAELLAGTPRYSADGNVLLYGVRSAVGWQVYPCEAAGAGPAPAYPGIKEGSLAITPDGSKVVFAARHFDRWLVIYNGAPLSTAGAPLQYQDVGVVRVSRNAGTGTIAMAVQRRGGWLVVVNGEERYKWYNELLQDALQVSRDGRRVGYYAVQGSNPWALWLDGIPQSCKVPYTYRFNPATGMLEGVSRDRDSMIFHHIRENRP